MIQTICALALTLLPHGPQAPTVCLDVARAAQRAGVDPALAVVVAGVESKWSDVTNSIGATGPMQVLPQYWGVDGQTATERGVLALAVLTEKYGTAAGLCRYAIGNAAPKSCRYSRRVLRLLEAME